MQRVPNQPAHVDRECGEPSDPVDERAQETAERDDLLAIAAHELRNPLHALALQLTLTRGMARSNGEVDTAVRLEKAQRMLARYSSRVMVLMELIRSNRAEHPVSLQQVDASALLATVADQLQQEARFRGVTLVTELAAACALTTDPMLLEQIVDNLLINAFKHASCSAVTLGLQTQPEGAVRITVSDDGRGIALEDQRLIFGKYRVAQSSQRGTGTGLGLWIVRRLATALGGTVELRSEPGHGTTFTLLLPPGSPPNRTPT